MVEEFAPSIILTSPWQIPLPSEEFVNHRVVIYFFGDHCWIPIKYCYLSKAIALHQKILAESGKEILVFPPDLNPNTF